MARESPGFGVKEIFRAPFFSSEKFVVEAQQWMMKNDSQYIELDNEYIGKSSAFYSQAN